MLTLLAFAFVLAQPVLPDPSAVAYVEGVAAGTGQHALADAVRNAQTAAVLEALDVLAASRDLTPYRPVIDRAERYVRRFQVIERTTGDDETRVRLEVSLFTDELVRDVAALAVASYRRPPKLAVMILAESADGAPQPLEDEAVLEPLLAPFDEAAFDVTSFPWHLYDPERVAAMLDEEGDEAARLAGQTLVDVLVAGRLTTRVDAPDPGTNLFHCRAALTVSVYARHENTQLGRAAAKVVVRSESPAEGLDEARGEVAKKLAREAFYFAAVGAVRLPREEEVVIDLSGDPPPGLAAETQACLEAVWGVERVDLLLDTPELVRFSVRYAGPLDPLLDALVGCPHEDAVVDAQRVAGRRIDLRVTGLHTENRREPLRAPAAE